jgi:hypothetical protein
MANRSNHSPEVLGVWIGVGVVVAAALLSIPINENDAGTAISNMAIPGLPSDAPELPLNVTVVLPAEALSR